MKRSALLAIAVLAVGAGGERHVLFSVQHFGTRTVLEPVVLLDPVERPPLDGDGARTSDHAPAKAFIQRYFVPGREFRMFGGGTVRVVEHKDPGPCADMSAVAISSGGNGTLASNEDRLNASRNRPPTAVESQSANVLAAHLFRERGVPLSGKTPITAKAVVVVRSSTAQLLVGQFTVEQSTDHGAVLFLISRRENDDWRAEHVSLMQFKNDSRGGARSLVGNVDLDRDGEDELVVRVQETEGYTYEVLKRANHAWRVIATGGGAGC
jgi:hypothetical protein